MLNQEHPVTCSLLPPMSIDRLTNFDADELPIQSFEAAKECARQMRLKESVSKNECDDPSPEVDQKASSDQ